MKEKQSALLFAAQSEEMTVLQLPILLALRRLDIEISLLIDRVTQKEVYGGISERVGLRWIYKKSLVSLFLVGAGVLDDIKRLRVVSRLKTSWRYVIATEMRRNRKTYEEVTVGRAYFRLLSRLAETYVRYIALETHCDQNNVLFCVVNDQCYLPQGLLHEVVTRRGGLSISVNASHKTNHLFVNTYNVHDRYKHPYSIDSSSLAGELARLSPLEVDIMKEEVVRELYQSYSEKSWYAEVATQINASLVKSSDLIKRLELDSSKPTVILFPHIFWDGSSFFGEDVFCDYKDWFERVLRFARDEKGVNWIIKIHPANICKKAREGITEEESSECMIIKRILGKDHSCIVLDGATNISTFSLLQIADTVLTVRGTVGIEAAVMGCNVITAGTGRYEKLGFTIDPETEEEYTAILGSLRNMKRRASPSDMAIVYAHRLFIKAPVRVTSGYFCYEQSELASLKAAMYYDETGNDADSMEVVKIIRNRCKWIR